MRAWAQSNDAELVQVAAPCRQQDVAPRGEAADCDLIASIGGDGTTLAAIRAAAEVHQPVLGISCGSLGVLTTVPGDGVSTALERFARGDWRARRLPALDVRHEGREDVVAYNDLAVVRAGEGQVFVSTWVDGVVAIRYAGDGCIVSTANGSTGYALAAGGPLLMLDTTAFLLTPLSAHGGFCPPLVIGVGSELRIEAEVRHGGGRLEVDGQIAGEEIGALTIRLRPEAATVVTFADTEPFLAGLRRRALLIDSPRVLADRRR